VFSASDGITLRLSESSHGSSLRQVLTDEPISVFVRTAFPGVVRGGEVIDRGEPWLALSWRHYMWWFADFEDRFTRGEIDPRSLLQQAENNWLMLQDRDVLFEEPRNNGSWARPWRQALADFKKATT
jgi:hypothetical protein